MLQSYDLVEVLIQLFSLGDQHLRWCRISAIKQCDTSILVMDDFD